MANKKVKERKTNVAFMLEPSFVAQLDRYAERIGISRSLLIRNCILTSLDDLKLLQKTGVLSVAKGGTNLFRFLNEASDKSSFDNSF